MHPDDDGPGALDVARAERRSVYPETGYALVAIDFSKPPGEALTHVETFPTIESVSFPPSGTTMEFVVYDSEGNAYRRDEVEDERGRLPE